MKNDYLDEQRKSDDFYLDMGVIPRRFDSQIRQAVEKVLAENGLRVVRVENTECQCQHKDISSDIEG